MQNLIQAGFITGTHSGIEEAVKFAQGEAATFTKKDIQEYIKKAQIQREIFEKEHGILFAEERKNALLD